MVPQNSLSFSRKFSIIPFTRSEGSMLKRRGPLFLVTNTIFAPTEPINEIKYWKISCIYSIVAQTRLRGRKTPVWFTGYETNPFPPRSNLVSTTLGSNFRPSIVHPPCGNQIFPRILQIFYRIILLLPLQEREREFIRENDFEQHREEE